MARSHATPRRSHDTLLGLVAIDEAGGLGAGSAWLLEELADAGRASRLTQVGGERDGQRLWFAAEHLPAIELLYPDAAASNASVAASTCPRGSALPCPDRDEARRIACCAATARCAAP